MCLVGEAACCAGRMCCDCLCMCCKSTFGTSSKVFARIGYVVFSLFWVLMSLVILFWGADALQPFKSFMQCPDASGGAFQCLGLSAIYRVSFVLALFHLLVFIICLFKNEPAAAFHDGCWATKFFFVFGMIIATFFISNDVFKGYGEFARIASIVFLIYQVLMMITIAYLINDKLVGNFDNTEYQSNGSCGWGAMLIVITLALYAANITWWVFMFMDFSSCGSSIGIIVVSIIAAILFIVLVLLKPREDASVLTSAIVTLYINYLGWSTLASDPDASCNPYLNSDKNTVFQIVTGIVFVMVALFSISSMTRNTSPSNNEEESLAQKINAPLAEEDNGEGKEGHEALQQNPDVEGQQPIKAQILNPISTATILFHIIMIFAMLYYAMLLTNWRDPDFSASKDDISVTSNVTYWVRLVAQWISIGIYGFSLIAPWICKGREFN